MSKFRDKTRVRLALLAAQSVIEMTNTEPPITAVDKLMEVTGPITVQGDDGKPITVQPGQVTMVALGQTRGPLEKSLLGLPTPPLDPSTGGPLRLREVLTGLGATSR